MKVKNNGMVFCLIKVQINRYLCQLYLRIRCCKLIYMKCMEFIILRIRLPIFFNPILAKVLILMLKVVLRCQSKLILPDKFNMKKWSIEQ